MLSYNSTNIGFRASPLDLTHLNTIRSYFHDKKKVFADQSTAIRFALQEISNQIRDGAYIETKQAMQQTCNAGHANNNNNHNE